MLYSTGLQMKSVLKSFVSVASMTTVIFLLKPQTTLGSICVTIKCTAQNNVYHQECHFGLDRPLRAVQLLLRFARR